MSIYMVAFRGGMPLGSLVSGYLATYIGAPMVIGINGVLLVVVARVFPRPQAAKCAKPEVSDTSTTTEGHGNERKCTVARLPPRNHEEHEEKQNTESTKARR